MRCVLLAAASFALLMPLPDHLERLQLEVVHAHPRGRLLVNSV